MKHILVLSNDPRTTSLVSSRASELKEEAHVEYFRRLEDFETFINPKEEEEPDKPDAPPKEVSEDKKHSFYVQALFKEKGLHLVILDQEILGKENPVEFIHKLKDRLESSGFNKLNVQTRFILLSFDSAASSIETLASPLIDDVILKPIDNQLFLQKLSMVLADKRTSAGEFLYKQEIESNIYIAQTGFIEELSDLGVAIRNKKGVKDGTIIRVFSKTFGDRADSSMLLRAFKSVAHPTIEGEFRVYYSYYGITAVQLQKIRRTLQAKQKKVQTGRTLSAVELQIFKKTRKKVAVIAFSAQMRTDIETVMTSNYINVDTIGFSSLVSFAKSIGVQLDEVGQPVGNAGALTVMPASAPAKVASAQASAPVATPQPTASGVSATTISEPPPAFTTEEYVFTIGRTDEVVSVQTKRSPFFDMNPAQLFASQKKWITFIHPEDLAETQEFLNYVKHNDKGHIFIRLKGPTGSIHFVKLEADPMKGASPPQTKIQINEFKGVDGQKAWQAARPKQITDGAHDVDAILIDASGVNEPIEAWSHYVKTFLENTKIIHDSRKVALIALLPERLIPKLDEFKKTFFSDVFLTPIDRKFLIDKINFHVAGLYTQHGLTIIQFDPHTADIKIAQEAKMTMASEYGIEIKSNVAIREGVFLRLFSSLFLDENYDGILARSYSAKVDDKNRAEYFNVFSFYGISDAFLKHIRKWIRDTYIAKKDSKQ